MEAGAGAGSRNEGAAASRPAVQRGLRRASGAFVAIGLGLGSFTWNLPAQARPQANAGLTLGVAEVGDRSDLFGSTRFTLGARGDVLFLRERNADWGLGPYAELLTTTFHDLQIGGGASALLPIHDYLPLVIFGGGYARNTERFGWEPGLAASIFWGSRSYNYHASYGLAAGLLLQGRYGLGDSRETAIILGAQVDLALVSLPFVLAYNAIRR